MPTFPYPRAKLRFALKILPRFFQKSGRVQGGALAGPGVEHR